MRRPNRLRRTYNTFKVVVNRAKQRVRSGGHLAYLGGGHQNLGDACMFEAAARQFAWPLVPYLGGAELKLERIGLSGPGFFRGCLLGGGTLINSYTLAAVKAAVRQGLPLAALGTGAGSGGFDMPATVNLDEWPDLLNRFTAVGVRGPRSLELLEQLGVRNARVVGDLALLHARSAAAVADNPPRFAINAIQPHGEARYGAAELAALGRAAAGLIRDGWQPIPIATDPTDAVALEAVLKNTPASGAATHYPRTAEEFLDLVAPCTAIISMRLHGSVLACCAGVPPVILSYLGKCEDFGASMKLDHLVVPIVSLHEAAVRERVEVIQAGGPRLRNEVLIQARHWKTELSELCRTVQDRMNCMKPLS